jgi:hypothetical protein
VFAGWVRLSAEGGHFQTLSRVQGPMLAMPGPSVDGGTGRNLMSSGPQYGESDSSLLNLCSNIC